MSLHDDPTLPPLREPRITVRALMFWLAALGLVIAILLGAGCAQIPQCPQVEAARLESQTTNYYLLSEQALAAFWERAQGLATGKCKIEPDA